MAQALGADWKYDSAADVMDEIGAVVPFYSGANYENLAARIRPAVALHQGPPARHAVSLRRRPAGARLQVRAHHPARPGRRAPTDYPLTLVFGHSLYYWNQNVLIQHSETLKREYRILLLDYPEGFVEMNPDDAKQLGIRDGEKIRLRAAGGSAVTAARVTPEVRSGAVFVPYFVRQVQQQIRGSTENGVQLIPVRVAKEAA